MIGPGSYALAATFATAWLCHAAHTLRTGDGRRSLLILAGVLFGALMLAVVTMFHNTARDAPPISSPLYSQRDIDRDARFWNSFAASLALVVALVAFFVAEACLRLAVRWRIGRRDTSRVPEPGI